MNMLLWRGITARVPAKDVKVRSSLVRRCVEARDDPVKQRVRRWLCDMDDEQLSRGLGLTSDDIAVLRGTEPRTQRRSDMTLPYCGSGLAPWL